MHRVGVVLLLLAVSAASAAAGSASSPVFEGCLTGPVVRPASIVVACADDNFYVSGLRWSAWTATVATATGTAHQNDCTPYCAAGHFHTYPLALRLFRPRRCSNGRTEFTRFTYRFTTAKPPGQAHSSSTITSPFLVGVHCP